MKHGTVSSLFLLLVIPMIREHEIIRSNYLLDSEDCSQVYQRFYHEPRTHSKFKINISLDPGVIH